MDVNKIKVFFRNYLDKFKPQPCPFCGDKCITYWMKNQCMNWKKDIKCPECGVKIRLGINYVKRIKVISKLLIIFTIIFMFFFKIAGVLFPSFVFIMFDFIILTPYADLDWEEERSWPPTLPSIIAQEKRDAEKQHLKEAKLAEKLAKKVARRKR